jgi:GTP-binding protein
VFHDRARIRVKGGRGGDGSLSFRREKFVPKGGPDGGDGGHGGDVVLVADPDLRDLGFFHRSTRFEAKRGRHGEGANKRGADGDDVELGVPVGTQVVDEEGRLLVDLAHAGARAVAAHGGHGGAGNRRFATPTHQAPRLAELGSPGEEATLELRLKLLADAALLGFPNAGKSSLLRRLSNAKPKVADYPFTTLAPVLGTVEAPDGRQLTVADVPGLLEGASEGVGLGDEFLAHLERARLFLHVIDAQEDVEERFRTIDGELAAYGAGLAERPQIVVLNKLDLVAEPPEFTVDDPRVLGVVATSAATGAGIDALVRALFELIPESAPSPVEEAEPADFLVYRPRPPRQRRFRIFRTPRGYRVRGEATEEELRAAGVKPDAVVEFEDE